MDNINIIIFIIIGLLVLIMISSKVQTNDKTQHTDKLIKKIKPYKKVKSLLTKNELFFYQNLKKVVYKYQYLIFTKVRLEDLTEVKKGVKDYQSWRNRVKSRHIDFVLCDNQTLEPILAIELDDSSHDTKERKERDNTIDAICESSELPILRIRNSEIKSLEDKILKKLN